MTSVWVGGFTLQNLAAEEVLGSIPNYLYLETEKLKTADWVEGTFGGHPDQF